MKKLILHVGLHKTATSSIQQTLARNAGALSKQNFFYPIFSRHDEAIINHSIPFYSLYSSHPEHYHINIKNGDNRIIELANGDYQRQIEHVLNMETNIILSGEDISMLPENALQNLKQTILDHGFQLVVMCSVRKPYLFTCSELQERIKSANGQLDNIEMMPKSAVIRTLKNVFADRMVFCSFEQDTQTEEGAVAAMLKRMGLDHTEFTIYSNNSGLGNLSTRFLAHLNQNHPSIVNGQLNPQGRGFFSHSVDTEKFLLTRSEFATIEKELKQENQTFLQMLGADYCDQDYALGEQPNIDLAIAKQLIIHYTTPHTLFSGVRYILQHSVLSPVELALAVPLDPESCYQLALAFKPHDVKHAFAFMAMAKKQSPDNHLINQQYEVLSHQFLATIKLGIGVITYNRLADLQTTVKAIVDHTWTSASHERLASVTLFVADDGSNDGTPQWCQAQNIACSSGQNRGVVRNKNRALYYLHHLQQCDVTLLIEDDCRPNSDTWLYDWVIASFLWGHVNFAHQRIIKKEGAVVSGNGQAYDPFACRLVTGQCTGCYCDELKKIGYLNPHFEGYGAGHVEWTERFVNQSQIIFDGMTQDKNGMTKKLTLFAAIDHGLLSQDAPTFKDANQLKRNQALKKQLGHQHGFCWPWKDDAEMLELLAELPSVVNTAV